MNRPIESVPVASLLDDMAFENPRPEEKWFTRGDFDPMHGANELRAAARRGLIELETADEAEDWRFRFTARGRDEVEKW